MIDKLEFVLALAREQHFGRAAEACGVTQPTLSAGLRSLEDALGVLIVNRSSRFIGFTPEGERVLDWARRIAGDAKAMRQDLAALKKGVVGHLRIAVIPTALPVAVRLTAPFQARHPGVRFSILSRTSTAVLQMMQDLEADAGITYLDNEPLGHVRTVPLYAEAYRLLTGTDGPFAGLPAITWAQAASTPLCLLTGDMQNRRIVDQMLRNAGREPVPAIESDSPLVLLSQVRTGHLSTILPPALAEGVGAMEGMRSIPIVDPAITHAVGLVVPQRELAAAALTALVAEARDLGRLLGSPKGAEDPADAPGR